MEPTEEPTLAPDGPRWWSDRVAKWVNETDGITPQSRRTYAEHVGILPEHFVRLGFTRPTNARMITRDMVEAYAHDKGLAPNTRAMNIGLLRMFLEFEKAPLAYERKVWKKPPRVARRRFWLTKEELTSLFNAAVGRERVVVALAGFNGLRSYEIRELRVGDCRMDMADPSMVFPGKFDKTRDIAMNRVVWNVLLPVVSGKPPAARVYPYGRTAIDRDLKRACRRAGIREYALHDLRRTYARLSVEAGATLISIQYVLGHASVSQSAYYAGADRVAMRRGIDLFSSFMERK
jgi:integrase